MLKEAKNMFEEKGFETANANSKNRCHSERRMPNSGILEFIFLKI